MLTRQAECRKSHDCKQFTRLGVSANIVASDVEAITILVAWVLHHRDDYRRGHSHFDFPPWLSDRGATAGESANPIGDSRLRDIKRVSSVSCRELYKLARVVSSHHDAGRNADFSSR